MKTRRFEFSVTPLNPAQVDAGSGVIYGVAIITSNVAAKGHDLYVDETTLRQLKECAEEKGRVPVKWNHRTGADAVNGYLENFRIAGGKLLGDWHLLKTHDRFAQALEMAERMPGNVGLSAAFMGEDEKSGGKTYARCSELLSVDLVAQPAANPDGLFEARDPRPRNRFGEFAGAATSADDPAAVSAAYNPEIIQDRKRRANVSAWREILTRIKGTMRPDPLPQPVSSQEFSDIRERGRGFLRGAAIAAGAVVGAKLGLKAAQVVKYRKAVASEQLAGRVVGVGKRSGQGVIHAGVADAKGRVAHLAPGRPSEKTQCATKIPLPLPRDVSTKGADRLAVDGPQLHSKEHPLQNSTFIRHVRCRKINLVFHHFLQTVTTRAIVVAAVDSQQVPRGPEYDGKLLIGQMNLRAFRREIRPEHHQ